MGTLSIRVDRSPEEYLAAGKALLLGREPEFSLLIGLVRARFGQAIDGPHLLRCLDDERLAGVAFLSPGNNLILGPLERAAIQRLVDFLLAVGAPVPGVVGPVASVDDFVTTFIARTGRPFRVNIRQHILANSEVIVPPHPGGIMKRAERSDITLAVEWFREFTQEALPNELRPDDEIRKVVEMRVENGWLRFWTLADEPVAMLGLGRPTDHGISIAPVYTPREFRGRGFASRLVADVTSEMLESGRRFCVLYTDASNPISNNVYKKVGYRWVADSKHVLFVE